MTPYWSDDKRGLAIYHGDCREVMPEFADGGFGSGILDPPYSYTGGATSGRHSRSDIQFWQCWMERIWQESERVLSPNGVAFIFSDWRTIAAVGHALEPHPDRLTKRDWRMSQVLVWDREGCGMGSPFRSSFELVGFARGPDWKNTLPKDISNVIRFPWYYGNHRHHGAEKPEGLYELLMGYVPEGSVLDPFMGSGSCLVAAAKLGIPCTGIEIEEKYCQMAVCRLEGGFMDDEPKHLFNLEETECTYS